MEAKGFLSKSSNIFSIAILLAGLSTFGAGVVISETNAKDMQKQKIKTEHQIEMLESSNSMLRKNLEIYKNQSQQQSKQIDSLTQQNSDLQQKVTTYENRNESPPTSSNVSPVESSQKKVNVIATAYVSNCEGCSGITATGIDVKNTTQYEGRRVIATDTSIIPLHTKVKVTLEDGSSFMAISEDTGGAINGHIIDVLVGNERTAINFGRQKATLTILD